MDRATTEDILRLLIESAKPVPTVNEAPCEDCGKTTCQWFSSIKKKEVTFRCNKCLKKRRKEHQKLNEDFVASLRAADEP